MSIGCCRSKYGRSDQGHTQGTDSENHVISSVSDSQKAGNSDTLRGLGIMPLSGIMTSSLPYSSAPTHNSFDILKCLTVFSASDGTQ